MPETRKLKVFISYASQDETRIRELYKRLSAEPWISPWFDKEMLLPGMDWDLEIYKALRAADAIIICLSTKSVSKEGYIQKEIKRALDYSDEKPDGTIYVIPLRLDDCQPPYRMQKWQWVDDFAANAHEKLLKSLQLRAEGLKISANTAKAPVSVPAPTDENLDLYKFIKITSPVIAKPFWIGKYPVTNAQYERFLKADDFANPDFWTGFPKYNKNGKLLGDWGKAGWNWLKGQFKALRDELEYFPSEMWKIEPSCWESNDFGIAQPRNPVVGVSWYEANAYCKWLLAHWYDLPEFHANPGIKPITLRLPLISEWIAAAGGNSPQGRYPWDLPGKVTEKEGEIFWRANLNNNGSTPVDEFPHGASPFGVMDLAGNANEWQANCVSVKSGYFIFHSGRWASTESWVDMWDSFDPDYQYESIGFRVVLAPHP
jgi:formylglycine-generating enzyme required for sulfatase activity